jgi:predicted RNA binding protein YcfA (HicA-like mRNA interferase family)
MKYSELYKLLREGGCYPDHEGKRHTMWFSPITGETFPVGRHKSEDVPRGTLKSILAAAGLGK